MTNATHTPWKLWNGYGPAADGLMRVERIGPDVSGGLRTDPGSLDINGTKEDLEMVVVAVNSHQAMLDALRDALGYLSAQREAGTMFQNLNFAEGGSAHSSQSIVASLEAAIALDEGGAS